MKYIDDIINRLSNAKSFIVCLWAILVCVAPGVVVAISGGMPFISLCACILLPVAICSWLLSVSGNHGAGILALFPVMFLSAFQIVLAFLYGQSGISVDMWLNVATTNAVEVKELLGNLSLALSVVAVMFLPVIVYGVAALMRGWRHSRSFRKGLLRFAAAMSVACVPLIYMAHYMYGLNPARDIFPVNAVCNLGKAIGRQGRINRYHETSSDFRFGAASLGCDSTDEIHVVVIGETSRAANWSMFGYGRPTTASIDGMDGLVGFPNTLSQSNTTHKSVPLLLSHLDVSQFGDSISCVKSFITAFKEAGYRTAFFSSQQRNGSYIDFFGEEAHECVFLKDSLSDRGCSDHDLLRLVRKEIVSGHKKHLIVLHTYGSHFNYNDRYPENMRVFTPDTYRDADYRYRRELVNAYDNTIVCTADLLRKIIMMLSGANVQATVTYTSDHGEDIFDDERRLFLHSSTVPTFNQLNVPFLIWMSGEYRRCNPRKYDNIVMNRNKPLLSTASLCHTLFDIAGIESPKYNRTLSLAAKNYRCACPVFINDYDEAVPLMLSGMSESDLRKVASMGFCIENRDCK